MPNRQILFIFHIPRLTQRLIPLTTDTRNTGAEQILEAATVTTWTFFSEIIREACAEFLGTAILTGIGIGANCQAVLSSNTQVSSSPKGVSAVVCYDVS